MATASLHRVLGTDEENRGLLAAALEGGATAGEAAGSSSANARPRRRRLAAAAAVSLASAALLGLSAVGGRWRRPGAAGGSASNDAASLAAEGGELSEAYSISIGAMRKAMHPPLDDYVETKIHMGRERDICLQPTTGYAHDWICHEFKWEGGGAFCQTWREKFFDGLDIRHGWEYIYGADSSTMPCNCTCCRRFLHGRPEKGGGLHVRMWPCRDGDQDQLFMVPRSGRGPIRLKRFPDRCLTVSSEAWPVGDSGDGHQLMLWLCGHNDGSGQTWELPLDGAGPIHWAENPEKCVDGGRLEQDNKLEAKLQIWDCDQHGRRAAEQLLLLDALQPPVMDAPRDNSKNRCKESTWPRREGDLICDECSAPVKFAEDLQNCDAYCKSVGRYCQSASAADHGCTPAFDIQCDTQQVPNHAICRCGQKFLRGHYGSLSEFWLSEAEIRHRVREMVDNFGIMEFQFYDAFEGFSHPPADDKALWTCAIQQRPVHRATVEAAVDEIRNLEGRAWLAVHAAATDPDDKVLTEGQWVMPPEDVVSKLDTVYFEASVRRLAGVSGHAVSPSYDQTYESMCGCDVGEQAILQKQTRDIDPATRIMDVVDMDPAWALRFVPQWAEFAAKLGFSGIHWDTFGDFGHSDETKGPSNPFRDDDGAPKPDITGFLRAALPILRRHGLLQTLNFVNGFGWDPVLLQLERGASWLSEVGRLVAFPYWEVWSAETEKEFLEHAARDEGGFVLSMYPGYSKYHCCLKNERQNAAEYGVWPLDLGVKRWQRALEAGGTYHLIVDGMRYLQGPFVPDAVRFSHREAARLQHFLNSAHPGVNHHSYLYGVNDEGELLRQPLLLISQETSWEPVPGAPGAVKVISATFDADTIYAVSTEHRVVSRHLSSEDIEWNLASAGDVKSIAISGDTIYAVMLPHLQLVQQRLSTMTLSSPWRAAPEGQEGAARRLGSGLLAHLQQVSTIFIFGRHLYGVDGFGRVVVKPLDHLEDAWEKLSKPGVTSVVRYGDTIYGSTVDGDVVMQRFSSMNEETPWTPCSKAGISSIALLLQASR